MDDRVHAGHGFEKAGAGGEVALDSVNVTSWVAGQDAGAVSFVAQGDDQVAPERARSAGDQYVHFSFNIVSENTLGVPTS
jgi:hypothetical protein